MNDKIMLLFYSKQPFESKWAFMQLYNQTHFVRVYTKCAVNNISENQQTN